MPTQSAPARRPPTRRTLAHGLSPARDTPGPRGTHQPQLRPLRSATTTDALLATNDPSEDPGQIPANGSVSEPRPSGRTPPMPSPDLAPLGRRRNASDRRRMATGRSRSPRSETRESSCHPLPMIRPRRKAACGCATWQAPSGCSWKTRRWTPSNSVKTDAWRSPPCRWT